MADKEKSLGQTVLGWFVVQEGKETEGLEHAAASPGGAAGAAAQDAAVNDLIARYANEPPPKPAYPQEVPSHTATASQAGPKPSQAQAGRLQGAAGPSGQSAAGAPARVTPRPPPAPASAGGGQGPAASVGQGAAARPASPQMTPAQLDFADVFRKQGLSAEQQAHVDRALQLLHNLPQETPKEIKRQIVEAALLAFGVPVDKIIESAALHLRALDLHTEKGQKQTQYLIDESTSRLKALEQEADRIRQVMQEQLDSQQGLTGACQAQKMKIQEVLEFFGQEAVDRVRSASVKLRDPPPSP